ncbi:hypothetical protein KC915_25140 [Enterobacter hormaechei]
MRLKPTGSRSGRRSTRKRWSWNDRSGSGRMTVRHCNKPDKTGLSAGIFVESLSHSPGCMTMQSGEIYRAKKAVLCRSFATGFTGLTPISR